MAKLKCPFCDVSAEGAFRLKKHLMGRRDYGGHEIPEYQADIIVRMQNGEELSDEENELVEETIENVKGNNGVYREENT